MKSMLRAMLAILTGATLIPLAASAGGWGVGVAIAYLQPPQKGIKSEVLGVPYVSYQGEWLNIDLGNISYSLLKLEEIHA